MGLSLNHVSRLDAPFQIVHEQIVVVPATGSHLVFNNVRKLLFVLSGECRHQVARHRGPGTDIHLRPGDVLALPHVCEQRYYALEPGKESRLHVIRLAFDPTALPPLLLGSDVSIAPPTSESDILAWADFGLHDIHLLHAARNREADTAVTETLMQLREEAEHRAPGCRLRVHALCVGLTILFARTRMERAGAGDVPPPPPRGAEFHAGKIKVYLRSRLHQPTRLAEVAAFIGLSEEHTARLFKAATGQTILEYGRRLRIAEAKSLLAATDSNLSEVARRTGFASLTVFTRNFTQEAGMTPSEFRRGIASHIG